MHDIWNPWHGCVKASEGCENCYMYFLDNLRGADARNVYKTNNFYYPLQKNRSGAYKVKSGEQIRVCMTSDFFIEQADGWRSEAWRIIRQRPDVRFFLLTKRPERVEQCLPPDWNGGWDNVFFNVSCENQRRANERIPHLLRLPFKHKGIMAAPLIGNLDIEQWLVNGQIEQVIAGGENYGGNRVCDFNWIKSLSGQCSRHDVKFCFIETGTRFRKDGRIYHLPSKRVQSEMAFKANVNNTGKPIHFKLSDPIGFEIAPNALHKPYFGEVCANCGSQPICNGCSRCRKCACKTDISNYSAST